MKETIISLIAKNCEWRKQVNEEFMPVCEKRLDKLEKMLPSGSGIDSGCRIIREKSGNDMVVITFSYHHMDEYGGWTDHSLIAKPVLWNEFEFKITGKNKDMIKDYLYDVFDTALRERVEEFTV